MLAEVCLPLTRIFYPLLVWLIEMVARIPAVRLVAMSFALQGNPVEW